MITYRDMQRNSYQFTEIHHMYVWKSFTVEMNLNKC